MKPILIAAIVILVCLPAVAQRSKGTIKGRVVSEDGQPIRNAVVNIFGISSSRTQSGRQATAVTDEEGNFQADGLEPAAYVVSARAIGYAMLGGSNPAEYPFSLRATYLGESVTITMIKGSVITGKVTSAAGDPVVAANVSALRIKDENGKPLSQAAFSGGGNRFTDDRGIYRFYGLAPGTYIVSAGGLMGSSMRATPYDGKLPTFYPSSTRDTAGEVVVRAYDEVSGVDIQYRGDSGFAVSGKIAGLPSSGSSAGMVRGTPVWLRQSGTGSVISSTVAMDESQGFSFYGIPNGDYELEANKQEINGDLSYSSLPKRVTVNGRDVAGVDLTLALNAAIAGNVVFENEQPVAEGGNCEVKRRTFMEEILIAARRDDPAENASSPASAARSMINRSVPEANGTFVIRNLQPARYRIHPEFPDESLYLKSMKMASGAAAGDPLRDGITLRSGARAEGLSLTVARGAAAVAGKVTAAEGSSLPAELFVYLLPAEAAAKDDLLRNREIRTDDAKFEFKNLAPGKYLMLSKPAPPLDPAKRNVKPLLWDSNERAKLRKEAEAANITIELKTCRRANDFELRFPK